MLPIGTLHKRQTAGMTPDEAPDTFLRCKSAGPCLRVSIKINTQNKTLLEKQIAYFRKHSTTPRWYITMNPQPLNEIFIFFLLSKLCPQKRMKRTIYSMLTTYDDTARFPTYVQTKSLLFRLLGNLIICW